MLLINISSMFALSSSLKEGLSQNLVYTGSIERIQRGIQLSSLFQQGNERDTRRRSDSFTMKRPTRPTKKFS